MSEKLVASAGMNVDAMRLNALKLADESLLMQLISVISGSMCIFAINYQNAAGFPSLALG